MESEEENLSSSSNESNASLDVNVNSEEVRTIGDNFSGGSNEDHSGERPCECYDCFQHWWRTIDDQTRHIYQSWAVYIIEIGATYCSSDCSMTRTAVESKPKKRRNDSLRTSHEWNGQGERLGDDTINIYCQRLQVAVNRRNKRIEGLMAIQGILYEYVDLSQHISGDVMVLQVIYDPGRTGHFLLVEWKPEERIVVIYDSLVPTLETVNQTLSRTVKTEIIAIFRHLYEDSSKIPIRIERHLPMQRDDWSCGLRVIGFLTRRALDLPAIGINYDLERLHTLYSRIMNSDNPTVDDFDYIKNCTDHSHVLSPSPAIMAHLNKETSIFEDVQLL